MDYNEAHGLLDSVYLPPIKRKEIMKFSIRNLSVLAYAQGFTLWHYKAAEPPDLHNFFGDASDMLASGDIVFITGKWGAMQVVVRDVNAAGGYVGVDPLKSSI